MNKFLINPVYFTKHALVDASIQFAKERSIQLQNFLLPDVFAKASCDLSREKLDLLFVPDQERCQAPKRVPASSCLLLGWLKSKEAASLISTIVQKKVRCKIIGVLILVHGDYSLLHDKQKESPGYDVFIELTPHWDVRACGNHSYVKDGEELVRVVPVPNTFTIVHRPAGVQSFIKYVNHSAARDKRLILQARFA